MVTYVYFSLQNWNKNHYVDNDGVKITLCQNGKQLNATM